jgi:hypothetical protein
MRKRRKLLGAAVALGAALAAWTAYGQLLAKKGPTYKGKTTDEWRVELRRWEPASVVYLDNGGRWTRWVYRPPAQEVWLARFGVGGRSHDEDLALLTGDREGVPVLLELLNFSSPKARRLAAQGLEAAAHLLSPLLPPLREWLTNALLVAVDDEDEDVRFDAERALLAWNTHATLTAGLRRDGADESERWGDLP